MNRHLFCVVGTFLLATAASAAAAATSRPPNIVYILADDLGWTDLGCQGSKYYETPNIDRLAAQGTRMMRYYNSQNCAPTRAVLMSGQYAPRTGMYTVNTLERGTAAERRMKVPANVGQLALDKFILPQAMKAAGYATGMFGKWHLGNSGDYHPSRRGFDEAVVSDGRHFDFLTHPAVDHPKGQYLADFLTDRAVDFIGRHHDKPFFLYLPHFAVHTPIHAKEEYVKAWEKKPARGTHWNPTYAAMIQSVDESVGRVLARLDELKLTNGTVVIFSSDNGGLGGYYRTEAASEKKGFTDNAPLRGGKGTLYEGGLRVPFIIRWPGVVRAGATNDTPVAHVDIYPTFVAIAGSKPRAGYTLDGMSFAGMLKDPPVRPAREAIYWHFPGYLESYVHPSGWRTAPAGAIHAGDFKLLEFFETGRVELYNVREDIGEHSDLAAKMPAKALELQAKLAAWRKTIKADMPVMKTAAELEADRRAPPAPRKKAKAADDQK
ncbi:MAG: sulfatase [Opitutaceae bacterium]|nr:sulfatase [Opitutaceae bacterium]